MKANVVMLAVCSLSAISAATTSSESHTSNTPTRCSIALPFNTIVLTQRPAFIPSQLCMRPAKPAIPLPPITKSLSTLTICDASGTEFFPTDCTPAPTSNAGPSSSQAAESVEEQAPSNVVRLHVMPTPTNVLVKRGEEMGLFDDISVDSFEQSDISSKWSAESIEVDSDSSGSESIEEEIELAWSGIDGNSDNVNSNGELGGVFAGLFGGIESVESSSNLVDKIQTEMLESSSMSLESSSVSMKSSSMSLESSSVSLKSWDQSDSSSSAGSSARVSRTETSDTTLSGPRSELGSTKPSSESLMEQSDASRSAESSAWTGHAESSETAKSGSESSIESSSQSSMAVHETAGSAAPQSTGSVLSMVVEEASMPFASEAPATALAYPNGVENAECAVGMFRCTDDKRSFDTCVHGRWGTIRTCSQGTTCLVVDGNSIACA